MFCSVDGANAIIALRCCHMNNRFEDYWESPPSGLTVTLMSRTLERSSKAWLTT
jgi:hypothetical protein